MFRIKICGITSPEDGRAAFEAGADVIGLNFYERSPRSVSLEQARRIMDVVPAAVGVFVNSPVEQVNEIAAELGLSHVQLHGDESPETFAQLAAEIDAIRVYRMGPQGFEGLVRDVQDCCQAGRQPSGVLVDAAAAGQYGGTGQTVHWAELANHRDSLGQVPLILAGGLSPENIAEAIQAVHPAAVDTASGVESAPGVKDMAMMRSFVESARAAFETA
jgi:phosphoribosylanthranilate isomerase